MSLSAAAVAAAAAAWVWVPDNATVVECDDFSVMRLPDYYEYHLTVLTFEPSGPIKEGVDAVIEQARAFGLPELRWPVSAGGPPGLAAELEARGASAVLSLDLLASDLSGGEPDLPPPEVKVTIRWASTFEVARDGTAVGVSGFGGTLPPDDQIREQAARDARTVPEGDGGMVVGYVDGAAAGSGGVTMADGVARLWGGAVVPAARGRGVYRKLLAERLAYAAAQGATMALVRGKVDTSGPILRRAGFAAFGQETTCGGNAGAGRRQARR
jgi:GNAT superfamily N-acetyltransferase